MPNPSQMLIFKCNRINAYTIAMKKHIKRECVGIYIYNASIYIYYPLSLCMTPYHKCTKPLQGELYNLTEEDYEHFEISEKKHSSLDGITIL